MDNQICGCKGCRTCLICENKLGIQEKLFETIKAAKNAYVYCPWCRKAWPGWDMNLYNNHPNHVGTPIDYAGVFIQLDFLSDDLEQDLMKNIDEIPWDLSQSGRRKQNYGPKCNFKKQKLRSGDFNGFPLFSKCIQDLFNDVSILDEFQTIEQCSLEYDPKRGASIDPHIDDCWIWGERIVTVNLLSDSVLTMNYYNGDKKKYNLYYTNKYPRIIDDSGVVIKEGSIPDFTFNSTNMTEYIVRIPMPKRSLLVLYGQARYDWEHCVLREDIQERRVCIAYREFTPPYLQDDVGNEIIEKSKIFWDHHINTKNC